MLIMYAPVESVSLPEKAQNQKQNNNKKNKIFLVKFIRLVYVFRVKILFAFAFAGFLCSFFSQPTFVTIFAKPLSLPLKRHSSFATIVKTQTGSYVIKHQKLRQTVFFCRQN
ncbi:hypothetical protein C7N43_36310 [Sphingobacteriales bacterium UPWRP_1]|nr:hypothetical protein C7N43_36310 [Sphingobacteriales bacterium UPWRP_1]